MKPGTPPFRWGNIKQLAHVILLALCLFIPLLLLSCGDDIVDPPIVTDTTPPAAITDLVVADTSTTTATLVWTAVGDDSTTGQAAAYDIRYSLSEITDSNWTAATQCTGEPSPKEPGEIDTFTVTGLESATVYYFAVKTLDEANNSSTISNVPSQMTTPSHYITWEKTYPDAWDQFANSVVIASDGGYVISGSADPRYACIFKVDEYGNQIWRKEYGGPLGEYIKHLLNTPDGGYLMAGDAGYTDPADDTLSIYLVKTDAYGNLEWETRYEKLAKTSVDAINLAHDGGYIVVGGAINEYRTPEIHNYAFIMKVNDLGDVEWMKPLDDTLDMNAYNSRAVEPTPDGGYLMLDLYLRLVKTDKLGNIIWEKDIRGQVDIGTWHRGWRIKPCSNNEYIIVGGIIPNRSEEMDVLLLKIDENGNVLWSKNYGGDFYDRGYDVVLAADGLALTGVTYSLGDSKYGDVYLAKTDFDGNLLWERSFGWDKYDAAWSLQIASDGGLVVSGERCAGPGTGEFYVIKTDPRGEL